MEGKQTTKINRSKGNEQKLRVIGGLSDEVSCQKFEEDVEYDVCNLKNWCTLLLLFKALLPLVLSPHFKSSMNGQKKINGYFLASCSVGLLLSCYALFVEVKAEGNKEYKAYCDINEHISCTKAFSSKYGKGFGIVGSLLGDDSVFNQPNSLGGIVFYLILAFMSYSGDKTVVKLQIFLCIISNFFSLYLAYILYFILEDFCMVCVGTYVVNAINLVLSISKWNTLKHSTVEKPVSLGKFHKKNK